MRTISYSRLHGYKFISYPLFGRLNYQRSNITNSEIINIFNRSKISRTSFRDEKTDELIESIRASDYENAITLVNKLGVDVNGHNLDENTALTDAAKRGDVIGIRFLIENLSANPHASCDCPYHKTALHYAAERNDKSAVKTLLSLGANPNLKDSRDMKASDLTTCSEIKLLLENHKLLDPLLNRCQNISVPS